MPDTRAITPRIASSPTSPTTAEIAATPSFSVRPTATPTAKISARLPNTTSPEAFISADTTGGIHSKCAAPMPSSRPATGSTATGIISDRPIFCRTTNASLNTTPPRGASAPAELREPRANLARGAQARHLAREILAVARRQPAHQRLDGRDRRHRHGKLVDSDSEQHRHRERLGGNPAAHPDPFAVAVRGL